MANENTKLEVLDVQGLDDIVSSLKDGSLVVGKAGSVDADGINGMIPLSKLPAEVLGRGKTVATDVERLALTSAQVQNGEIIKVASTGRMYLVSDATKLGTSNAAGAFIPFGDSVSEAALAQTNAEVARIDSVMQEGLNKRYTIQETDSKVQNAIVGLALQVDENYVSKEVGKGLSTHDFTTLLKQKLDGLTNYDDTALVSALADLRSLLDAYLPLTGGTMKGNVTMQAEQMSATRTGLVRCIGYSNYDGTSDAKIGAYYSQGNKFEHIFIGWGDIPWTLADCLSISSDRFTYKNQKIWHAGNDGSESGLDADLLDGKQPDELNVGSADNAAALNGKDGAWFRNNALMFTVVKAASNGGQTVDATADAAEGGLLSNYSSSNKWVNAPAGMSYGIIYTIKGENSTMPGQLAWDINHNSPTPTRNLWWRAGCNGDDYSGFQNDWHQVAFTDGEVAKLTTRQLKNEDLNDLRTPGTFYYGGSGNMCANKPDGVGIFGLQVLATDTHTRIQVMTLNNGSVLKRHYTSSVNNIWGPWKRMLTEDDIAPLLARIEALEAAIA